MKAKSHRKGSSFSTLPVTASAAGDELGSRWRETNSGRRRLHGPLRPLVVLVPGVPYGFHNPLTWVMPVTGPFLTNWGEGGGRDGQETSRAQQRPWLPFLRPAAAPSSWECRHLLVWRLPVSLPAVRVHFCSGPRGLLHHSHPPLRAPSVAPLQTPPPGDILKTSREETRWPHTRAREASEPPAELFPPPPSNPSYPGHPPHRNTFSGGGLHSEITALIPLPLQVCEENTDSS